MAARPRIRLAGIGSRSKLRSTGYEERLCNAVANRSSGMENSSEPRKVKREIHRARAPALLPPSTRFFSLLPLLLSLLLCDVDNRIPRSSWLILPRAKYRGVERGRNVTNVDWGKISLQRIVMAIRQHFFSSIKRSNSWLFRSYLRDLGRCCVL